MLKILIVDDYQAMLTLLENQLEVCLPNLGVEDFKIQQAKNGEEALKKAKEFSPSLIITDITMPKMDGIKLIKELRPTSCNFIVLSGRVHEHKETLEEMGTNYLSKPCSLEKLKEMLDKVLSNK